MKLKTCGALLVTAVLVAACSPKEGSEDWCKALEDKPKSQWSMEEAGLYAKHCIFENDTDSESESDSGFE